MNRSAEHPLGSFQNASHRAERMLGAPISGALARGQFRKELEATNVTNET